MNRITRIDVYMRTSTQIVTIFRGSRFPRMYVNPSRMSLLRICDVAAKEAIADRARLHPNCTGWTLDLLDRASPA